MGWIVALLLLIALAVLPIGVRIIFRTEQLKILLLLGPIQLNVYPVNKDKKPKNEVKKKVPDTKQSSSTSSPKIKLSLETLRPIITVVFDFLRNFQKKIRINDLQLKMILAGGDPCDLAVNYGKAWAAFSNIDPILDRYFIIKKKNINLECDFCAEKTVFHFKVDITITLARILHLLLWHGTKILKEIIKFKNLRKAV